MILVLNFIYVVCLLGPFQEPADIVDASIAEFKYESSLDELEASDKQRAKLRLLLKRQRQLSKELVSLVKNGNLVNGRQLGEEPGDNVASTIEANRASAEKLIASILNEKQRARLRQLVNWRSSMAEGNKSTVLALCSQSGNQFLALESRELARFKGQFGRSQADYIGQVIGYRRAMESIISAEKLKPIWSNDRGIKLTAIKSIWAFQYFAVNFQGEPEAEKRLETLLSETQLAINQPGSRESPEALERRFQTIYEQLQNEIDDGEFCRLSRRFLRKSLQEFKDGQELNADVANFFGLSEIEVSQARGKLEQWQRTQNLEYEAFQLQQLTEFKSQLSERELANLAEHFGDPPREHLQYFTSRALAVEPAK